MAEDFKIDEQELKRRLKQVVWDYNISEDDLLEIFLRGKTITGLNQTQLKAKLLNGNNWYTILKLVGIENAKTLLAPEITSILFPRQLRERYQHARRVLFE